MKYILQHIVSFLGKKVIVLWGQVTILLVVGFFLQVPLVQAATFSVSGTLYSDQGTTTVGAGKAVRMAVGTSTPSVHATTTSAGGVWTFTGIDDASVSSTTPFIFWLDGDVKDATTVFAGYASANLSTIPLYYDKTVVYTASTTAVVDIVAAGVRYDSADDADILFTESGGTTLTLNSPLIVKRGLVRFGGNGILRGDFVNEGTFQSTGLFTFNKPIDTTSAYVSGIDTTGSTIATGVIGGNAVVKVGNYAYMGKDGNVTACSQTGGSALGCELMVFDVSDPVIPVFVAGRDASGNAAGTASGTINSLSVSGNFLYVGLNASTTACSQTAGSAIGCEVQVYDISSSTNPVYVAGRDSSGSAAGTGGASVLSLSVYQGFLYAGKTGDATACSQTAGSAVGCELIAFNIASTTNPTYTAGRDTSGNATGTTTLSVFSVLADNNAIYIAKAGNATACTQVAGTATGCELMVFTASGTNPIFAAGRDASASTNGTGNEALNTLLVRFGYLYVGKIGNATACSNTAGSALGCEMQVYDTLSSSTNPNYIVGRDASGSAAGTGNASVFSLGFENEFVYAAKAGNITACSQTVGSAIGCELIVFNISSSTNPTYQLGRDVGGDAAGTQAVTMESVFVTGGYVYAAKAGSSTACAQTAGAGAAACELTLFESLLPTTLTLAGTLVDGSQLGNVMASSAVQFLANASTSNFSIAATGTVYFPPVITVTGTYANSGAGIFNILSDRLFLEGTSPTSITGNLQASSALPFVTISGTGLKSFTGPALIADINIQPGASVNFNSATYTIERSFTNEGTQTNSGQFIFGDFPGDLAGGRDVSGSATGTQNGAVQDVLVFGNFMYVANTANGTACTQVAGTAIGCELMVFDVSSSTNPIYRAGRDADGSATGAQSLAIQDLAISGNYLFIAKAGSGTACSNTAGSAIGCEFMVFDVSSSTNPIYRVGRDISGSAAGTGNSNALAVSVSSSSLFLMKAGNATACSQTAGSAIGCEFMVFDVSSSTNPIYAAGRDADTSLAGTQNVAYNAAVVVGSHIYVAKAGSATACSQTLGAAVGCELHVFNISSTTNPVYVAGRDASGNATGTQNLAIQEIVSAGNSIYVSKPGSATACSNAAGSAVGCELMVFDISSSTNPIYVVGRDVTGSAAGTGNLNMQELAVKDSFLYGSKVANATICSDVAGSALGCELMVFDISSSTNPIYSYGRDVTGTATGTGSLAINTLSPATQSIMIGIAGDGTACSTVAGIGCELKTLPLPSPARVSGSLTGANDFTNVTLFQSGAEFLSAAEVNNFTNNNSVSIAPSQLTINGAYVNNGTVLHGTGEVILTSGGDISGNVTASSSFYGLQINGNTTVFPSLASTTNLTITSGGTFIAPSSALTVKGNLSNQGTFDETGGVLYLENNVVGGILSYVAGRDASGNADGTNDAIVYGLAAKNNTLYVGGQNFSSTACSQTAGSALPCEIKVFDISSSTNPVFVAGRDISGSAGGSSDGRIITMMVIGDYLYIGKASDATSCSQIAGSAQGCELMIFDISSTTNPVYVAGRDSAGNAGGGTNGDFTSFATAGNYLYVGKGGAAAACSQTAGSASGCELHVYDISSPTNPIYVAGRDVSGSATGAVNSFAWAVTIANNHLYVGQEADATACSQTAGSASGCELHVYDISSSTNPIYVAGRDSDASNTGTGNQTVEVLTTKGNSLYVGGDGTSDACSQTAGSASGCEFKVFDISSSTNPVYVAGRDDSGNSVGVQSSTIVTMLVSANALYLGKDNFSGSSCSQIAGLASACELQVYDISSSTNPIYVAGRDNSGSDAGGGDYTTVHAITIQNNVLYVGKEDYSSSACSQTAGSAQGCELMVFANPFPTGLISGSLTAASTLGNVSANGAISFLSTASTSNFTILGGAMSAYSDMSVSGNFTNSGTMSYGATSTVYLSGISSQAISGTLNASSSFANLTILSTATTTFSSPVAVSNHFNVPTPNAKLVFAAGATSTVGSTTITGTAGNTVRLSSTNPGQQAGFTVFGNYDIEHVTVRDSYASTTQGGIYAIGINGGNTTNWFLSAFGINVTDTSPITPVTLSPGAPATTTSRFTLSTDIATSTDIISIGVSLLTPNATTGIALIEITNESGSVVYGSTTNPTSTPVSIVLDDATLTIDDTPTNYLVRVTPKSHAAMPVPFGAEYRVSTRVSSITGNGLPINTATFGAVVTIDNLSPGSSFYALEDFETGDLTGFSTSGDVSWSTTTDSVSSGVYSAKSGLIADEQVSNLSYVITVASGTQMYFDRRVSSEEDYDYLQLYVNEVLIDSWSGEVAWSTVGPYALSEGEKTVRFSYTKDNSNSDGSDTAWIDNLEFVLGTPLTTPTATTTGANATISYTTPGDADYNSTIVLYSTSPLADTPVEGATYIATDIIGAATVGCVDATGVSATSSTCVISGLTPLTTYYFSAYYKDDAGNYSPANDLAAFLMELSDALFNFSGVLYGEDRVTPIATPQTLTVATPVNGVFSTSSVSTTGTFNFGFSAGIIPGQPVTIYVDGNSALRAATVLKVATSTTISNIPLYQNHVVLKSQQGTTTPFTNTSLAMYDSGDDADIRFTHASGTNALTTLYQQDLYLASGTNYVPQGNVSVGGSFTATTSTLVNFATSTLTLTSTSTETIAGVSQFGNLAFTGNGGDYSISSAEASTTNLTIGSGATFTAPAALTVGGNFAIESGTVTAPVGTITVAGDFTQNGTFTTNSASLEVWTTRTATPSQIWGGVAYGNSRYVAVGGGDFERVMTSTDGITWATSTAVGNNDYWAAITYGNGLFVAVSAGGDDRVMTSPDGISWTARPAAGDDDEWQAVTYGNGLFVAVAWTGDDRVMTSPDGINWTPQSISGISSDWRGITYGNGLFVAIGNGGADRVMTSPDGISWTARPAAGDDDNWRGITYGNGLYVAVGNGPAERVMFSTDGVSWATTTAAGDTEFWAAVTYGNGLFVAVSSESGDSVMTSLDGINWTARSAAGNYDRWFGVTYGNGLYVAVSQYSNNRVMTSPGYSLLYFTGTSPQTISGNLRGTNALPSVLFKNSGTKTFTGNASTTDFLVFNTSGTVTAPSTLSISGNLNNQSTFISPTNLFLAGAAQVVSGNMTGSSAFTTLTIAGTDQKTFTNNASTTNLVINAGAELSMPAALSVLGNYTNNGTSSSYGTSWTPRLIPSAQNRWQGIAYANNLYVVVGDFTGDRIMTSPDGVTWTTRSTPGISGDWQAVTYGNGLFVAVGYGGDNVITSTDGITWATSTAVGNDDRWTDITYANGLFVAVGEDGNNRVMTSPDGIIWTAHSVGGNDDQWSGVTYGNGQYVAVSYFSSDTVITSPDGIAWTTRFAVGDNDGWQDIIYDNNLYVAVGYGEDRVMTSPDGINWTGRSAAGDNDQWNAVTYEHGLYVAVGSGYNDRVMTSTDSITWIGRSAAGDNDQWSAVISANEQFIAVGEGDDRVMTSVLSATNFAGTSTQSVSGELSGTSAFGKLTVTNNTATTSFTSAVAADQLILTTPSTTVAFAAGATSTFNTVTITGTEGNKVRLRSTTPDTRFGFAIVDTYSITFVDVKDSRGTTTAGIIYASGIDSGNTVGWSFEEVPNIAFTSLTPYQFYVGQATTTLSTFTITDAFIPTIATSTDIRISFATTTTNFRFNTGTTNLTFGGSAAGKVSSTVSYEDGGATLVINVTSNFGPVDTLTISGVTVGSFASISTAASNFLLYTDGNATGTPQATDSQPIRITGLLNLQNHTEGQVDNEFSFRNEDDIPVFAFNLTGTGETITVGDLSLTLSGIQGIDSGNLSDFKLYRDTDNDLVLDGGDLLIDGSGILTINGQNGAVTFSTDFVSSTTANYFITADINSIQLGDSVVFSLPPLGLNALGANSLFLPVILTTVDSVQHLRNIGGGGGANAAIGGAAPGGDGDQGGGETGGGGGAGEEEDGENIASDPDFTRPTATGDSFNEWTDGANALLSDGTYATAASTNLRQSYNGFGFNIPGGNTIAGIAVKLDASGTTANGTIDVSLSWDGGSSYTTAKATPTFTGTDVVYTVGNQTDLWGRSWTGAQFDPSLFRLRVSAQPASNTIRLDALEVRVYHQAGGGGAGGGGGI